MKNNKLEKNFNDKLVALLKTDKRFVDKNGDLIKDEVVDNARKFDSALIELLFRVDVFRLKFFKQIEQIKECWVFNAALFVDFVKDKHFLSDSYTKFGNKIGLALDGKRLGEREEVALVWMFKDCVLEGGMSDEKNKRKEIFFNEILAQDEIDRLLAPKALTKGIRFSRGNEQSNIKLIRDKESGLIRDNLIIKGNNLLAMHSLKQQFAGKIKLIYIDPPYNTGSDGFKYNDNFNHSTWLTFMKNRLEVARELLHNDGVIFVQCDDNEQAYLKVLMDEIFGRDNFINCISVTMKESAGASGGGEDKKLKKNIEYLILFSKEIGSYSYNRDVRINQKIDDLKNFSYNKVLLKSNRNKQKSIQVLEGSVNFYEYKIQSIKDLSKQENIDLFQAYQKYFKHIFRTSNSQTSIRQKVNNAVGEYKNKLYSYTYFPRSGKNKGKETEVFYFHGDQVLFLSENHKIMDNQINKSNPVGSLWDDIKTTGISSEGSVKYNNGKKPEKLVQRIIDLSTQPGDIVLDYHLGSGTTAAVAHKMGRQYIGIEQMDYIEPIAVERLKKVVAGDEQSGISKTVNWQGGGEFVYLELKRYNQEFIDRIQSAKTTAALKKILEEMKIKSFPDYNVDLKKVDSAFKKCEKLPFQEQQKALVSILDKTQLYVNMSEIDDADFKCSKEEKKLSNQFYGKLDQ